MTSTLAAELGKKDIYVACPDLSTFNRRRPTPLRLAYDDIVNVYSNYRSRHKKRGRVISKREAYEKTREAHLKNCSDGNVVPPPAKRQASSSSTAQSKPSSDPSAVRHPNATETDVLRWFDVWDSKTHEELFRDAPFMDVCYEVCFRSLKATPHFSNKRYWKEVRDLIDQERNGRTRSKLLAELNCAMEDGDDPRRPLPDELVVKIYQRREDLDSDGQPIEYVSEVQHKEDSEQVDRKEDSEQVEQNEDSEGAVVAAAVFKELSRRPRRQSTTMEERQSWVEEQLQHIIAENAELKKRQSEMEGKLTLLLAERQNVR